MAIRDQLPMDQRTADRTGRVLIVCGDLFFSSQVSGMVRQAGFEPVLEMQPARAAGMLVDHDWSGVVVDVETNGLDIPALITALGDPPRPRVVAFGPHVHTARLEAARAAGCDEVLTRGQISSSSQQLRTALVGPTAI